MLNMGREANPCRIHLSMMLGGWFLEKGRGSGTRKEGASKTFEPTQEKEKGEMLEEVSSSSISSDSKREGQDRVCGMGREGGSQK